MRDYSHSLIQSGGAWVSPETRISSSQTKDLSGWMDLQDGPANSTGHDCLVLVQFNLVDTYFYSI